MLIKKLEQHAEQTTGVLGVVFVVLSVFVTAGLIGRYLDETTRPVPRVTTRQTQALQVSPHLGNLGLEGID
ncbi:hypothetical protein [Bradyrhizobium sp. P5_C11_2]